MLVRRSDHFERGEKLVRALDHGRDITNDKQTQHGNVRSMQYEQEAGGHA